MGVNFAKSALIKVKGSSGEFKDINSIRGKSAYEYAVEGGYKGTEEQFKTDVLGLPGGGETGQVVTKMQDGTAQWNNLPAALPEGGTKGQVVTMGENNNAVWADSTGVQSNWNINDETDHAYVKNRTHHSEITVSEILAETQISFSEAQYFTTDIILDLVAGDTYTVDWNGTKYECVAQTIEDNGMQLGIYLGDFNLMQEGEITTGEPFVIISVDSGYVSVIGANTCIYSLNDMTTGVESSTATVSITNIKEIIYHLDSKYIKDMYYTKHVEACILPETTSAETGLEIYGILPLKEGVEYIVNWNGVKYTSTARAFDSGDISGVFLGNGYLFDSGEPENPFMLISGYIDGVNKSVISNVDDSSPDNGFTISIYVDTDIVHKIDKKYLPDEAATKDYVDNKEHLAYRELMIPDESLFVKICYADGKYVATNRFNNGGFNIFYSEDGINWNNVFYQESYRACSICYGNGVFVIGCNIDTILYSKDCITWTRVDVCDASLNSANEWYVCYGNNKFVAISNDMYAAYSEDGITWTKNTITYSTWCSICYGNNKFIAVSGSIVTYSEDGITWTDVQLPITINSYKTDICYGNGKFIIVTKNNILLYSEDGITWTQSVAPTLENPILCYGNGRFVVIDHNVYDVIYYSEDGITWNESSCSMKLGCICYDGDKFIVLSIYYDGMYAISYDGITWNNAAILQGNEYVTEQIVDFIGKNLKIGLLEEHVTDTSLHLSASTRVANPNKLKFTGTVNEEYDGTKEVSVEMTHSKNCMIMKDTVTGYEYSITLENGIFVPHIVCTGIEVTKLPDKVDYTDSDAFDPTGMVVIAKYADGTTKEITDYTYDEYVEIGSDKHDIFYTEYGVTKSTSVSITTKTLEFALQDFYYTTNDDGTYTITGWKGTYNGESSTKCIVPNSSLIIL